MTAPKKTATQSTLPAKAEAAPIQPFQVESIIRNTQDLAIMGRYMSESGFFPGLSDVAKACMVIEKGRELGILPVSSGQVIHPIKTQDGTKLAIEAKLYGAIAMNSGVRWTVKKKDHTGCTLEFYSIIDKTIPHHIETFTMVDAKRAGLSEKKNWLWYPEEMCYNRCLLKGIRVFDPRICMGLYSVEEVRDFKKIGDEYILPEDTLAAEIIPQAETAPDQSAREKRGEAPLPPRTTDDYTQAEDLGMGMAKERRQQPARPEAPDPGDYDDGFMPYDVEPTPGELNPGTRELAPATTADPEILIHKQFILDYMNVQQFAHLYPDFKEWLAVFQTSRSPMKNFVARNQFGQWSLEKGSKPDIKILADNIKWTMDKFIEHCFTVLKMSKVGIHSNPALAVDPD